MVYFGIPLRSKFSSNNWEIVSKLFNRTLWSVYNQKTNYLFKIIVVCHELPELEKKYDKNVVEFHQVSTPYPQNLKEQMNDKGYKVHVIGKIIRDYGGGFTMIVDADDLISNKIVEFVYKNIKLNNFGWYVSVGYCFYLDKIRLNIAPKFPSGSNTIINYTRELLPSNMENAWKSSVPENEFIIIKGHSRKVKIEACKNIGRPLQALPFKGAIYVLGTGDNHSTLSGYRSSLREFLDNTITRRRITDKIKEEFSIDWL